MSLHLKRKESLSNGIRRLARNEAETILACLCPRNGLEAESLHAARKSVKRMRALLRLINGTLSREVFEAENRFYKEAGRMLSPLRDAEVLVLTAQKLRRQTKPSGQSLLRRLEKDLMIQRRARLRELSTSAGSWQQALHAALRRIDRWELDSLNKEQLLHGLRRAYNKGRGKFKRVRKNPTGEMLHAWRKRVKELCSDLSVMHSRLHNSAKAAIRDFGELADCIGLDHDLSMLQSAVRQHGSPAEIKAVLSVIARQRRCLKKAAFKAGSKLYARKPKCFLAKIQA
jgi:CHAD domain-containing protein